MVGLWAEGVSFDRLRTASDLLVAGGRVTGLLGGYLLLVQVALMARIPWLERRIGSDWLTNWHRVVGSFLVSLLVLHALLLISGYAMVDRMGFLDEAVQVVSNYPGVLMATVALGLLVAIGASSARRARAALNYETWHFVHLYAYLAVLLGFSHQIASGADFIRQPAAQVVWAGAHVLVAVCVIAFRVVQPVSLSWRHKLRVHEVVAEGDGVLSVYVTGYGLDLMGAQAGQFFRWRFMTPYTWWQAHPFSLSAAPTKRMLRLTIKMVGDHTKMLRRLRPGTPVIAEGPYGALTGVQRKNRRVLLLAGGIGITPIRALLEGLPAAPGDITVLFRGDESGATVFAQEMETLARGRGALVHYLLGPRARCCPQHDPLSPERITELVPDVRQRDAYICGSPGMMDAARRSLRRAGVPFGQIHAERFDM
jgi:predicted ferric reductase